MIDERHEELASLYAFDLLEGAELAQFEAALARDPELQALVRELRQTSTTLAYTAPSQVPPPALKQRLGTKPAIWIDDDQLRASRDFSAEIPDSVRSSAVFLLLTSPTYIRSTYCVAEECRTFADSLPARRARFASEEFAAERGHLLVQPIARAFGGTEEGRARVVVDGRDLVLAGRSEITEVRAAARGADDTTVVADFHRHVRGEGIRAEHADLGAPPRWSGLRGRCKRGRRACRAGAGEEDCGQSMRAHLS